MPRANPYRLDEISKHNAVVKANILLAWARHEMIQYYFRGAWHDYTEHYSPTVDRIVDWRIAAAQKLVDPKDLPYIFVTQFYHLRVVHFRSQVTTEQIARWYDIGTTWSTDGITSQSFETDTTT